MSIVSFWATCSRGILPNNILYTHLKCWPEGGRIIEVHRTVHVLAQYPLIKYWFYALPHSSS